jgi:hypothetical protein
LSSQALPRWASLAALDQRRRDEPRQYDCSARITIGCCTRAASTSCAAKAARCASSRRTDTRSRGTEYRLEDFVDDGLAEDADEGPSREHYCPEISENRFNWLRVSTVSGRDSISASS